MAVTLGDRTEYLTPDELLARQSYDQGFAAPSFGFKAGLDVTLALALLADRFEVTVPELLERARLRASGSSDRSPARCRHASSRPRR